MGRESGWPGWSGSLKIPAERSERETIGPVNSSPAGAVSRRSEGYFETRLGGFGPSAGCRASPRRRRCRLVREGDGARGASSQ
jgi:hypothetical protein